MSTCGRSCRAGLADNILVSSCSSWLLKGAGRRVSQGALCVYLLAWLQGILSSFFYKVRQFVVPAHLTSQPDSQPAHCWQ